MTPAPKRRRPILVALRTASIIAATLALILGVLPVVLGAAAPRLPIGG